jgi:TatD DNase family protein
MITVGTQRDTSALAVALAEKYPGDIWATVGLHPVHTTASYHDVKELGGGEAARAFTSRGEEFDYAYYESLARRPEVVAIGECGLDYYRSQGDQNEKIKNQNVQKEVFREHIRLAESVGKALMIHCRPSKGTDDAYEDLLREFSIFNFQFPKIVHFYVGGLEITKKLLDAGFYFTLGGVITFARDYDESIKLIPLDRILLETDAPYVAPAPYRGKKNEPAYIIETAKKLAEIKGVDYETVVSQTTANAEKVFQMKPYG